MALPFGGYGRGKGSLGADGLLGLLRSGDKGQAPPGGPGCLSHGLAGDSRSVDIHPTPDEEIKRGETMIDLSFHSSLPYLGRLPGDIHLQRKGVSVYSPLSLS